MHFVHKFCRKMAVVLVDSGQHLWFGHDTVTQIGRQMRYGRIMWPVVIAVICVIAPRFGQKLRQTIKASGTAGRESRC